MPKKRKSYISVSKIAPPLNLDTQTDGQTDRQTDNSAMKHESMLHWKTNMRKFRLMVWGLKKQCHILGVIRNPKFHAKKEVAPFANQMWEMRFIG